jgi:hypothetical protein
MSVQQQRKRLQQQGRKLNPLYEDYSGINRRAVSLFPGESFAEESTHFELTNRSTVRQQLLNVEAQHLTCCVKIDSPKFKSRSALLIVQGRVLACVYGSLTVPQQVFGRNAYHQLMTEITHMGNVFDSYVLNDRLVLAAGSMFHGELFNATRDRSPVNALKFVIEQFETCETPGSVALIDEFERPVCLIYFSNHEILGLYSFLDEIKVQDMNTLVDYLKSHPRTKVMASMLNLADYNLLRDLTFSLSGLSTEQLIVKASEPLVQLEGEEFEQTQFIQSQFGQTRFGQVEDGEFSQNQLDAARLILMKTIKPRNQPEAVRTDRFISSGRPNAAPRLNQTINVNNPFRIDPTRTF